jgi:hypothetical protein
LGEEFTLQKKTAWKMNRPEPFACAAKNFGKIPFYTRVTTVPRVSAFARDSSHCVSIAAAFIVSAERARTYILIPLNCLHDSRGHDMLSKEGRGNGPALESSRRAVV